MADWLGNDDGGSLGLLLATGNAEGISRGTLVEGDALGRTGTSCAGFALDRLGNDEGIEEGEKIGCLDCDGEFESDGDKLGFGDLVGWMDKDGSQEGSWDGAAMFVGAIEGFASNPGGVLDGLSVPPPTAKFWFGVMVDTP